MTTDAVGGLWQYAVTLSAELIEAGHAVTLAVLGPAPSPDQVKQAKDITGLQLLPTDLPLDWLADDRGQINQAAQELADLVQSTGANLLHCNNPALAGAAHFAVPVVAVAHGCVATWWKAARQQPLAPEFAWHADAMRAGLTAADATVAPSASFANDLRDVYSLSRTPAAVHNGRTPIDLVGGAAPQLDAALTVGRLWDAAKNAAVLDRAARSLDHPLLAAGAMRGPHGEEITPSHLQCLGQRSEVELAELYRLRPVFVSAATFEPFGLAVLEAASAGCALVLSDIPTFRELWDGAAVFVPASDAEGFAAAIGALIGDPARRAALGEAAKQRSERYTPTAMADQMLAIYRTVLSGQAVAA